MDKHIRTIYALLVVGFISLSVQLWLQSRAINELNIKLEAVRELLFIVPVNDILISLILEKLHVPEG